MSFVHYSEVNTINDGSLVINEDGDLDLVYEMDWSQIEDEASGILAERRDRQLLATFVRVDGTETDDELEEAKGYLRQSLKEGRIR